jgi:hypothetical protein
MTEIFNIILIIIILVITYHCIQCSKLDINNNNQDINRQDINNNKQDISRQDINNNITSQNVTSQDINNIVPSNLSTIKPNIIEKFTDTNTQYITFDYDLRPIEKEYIKEQENGAFLYTWYPNTWIDHIDENGKPVYNSREHVTGKSDTFIDPKTSASYDFNNIKTINMSGVLKPEDFQGKTIKEVYDNSMIDYKKLGPKKIMMTDDTSDIVMPGGSNLVYYTPDTWTYEDETPENGGVLYDNLYANDPMTQNTVAVFN